MIKQLKDAIYQRAAGLSDKQLEKEYYDGVMDCLGSEAEEMYERGYEIADIKQREKIEKYIQEKSHIIEQLCDKRGIKLWEDCNIPHIDIEEKIKQLTKDFKLCYPCAQFIGFEKDGKLKDAECLEDRDCTKCELCRRVAKILIEDGWTKEE